MNSIRAVLEELVGSHHKNCDCLACRRGGRIDSALMSIAEIVERMEKETTAGERSMGNPVKSTRFNLGYNQAISDIVSLIKGVRE